MSRMLDDQEQYEWIKQWTTKQRRKQAEILGKVLDILEG